MDIYVDPEEAPVPRVGIPQPYSPHSPFSAPPEEKRQYYKVGRRPVDIPFVGEALSHGDKEHLQFISDTGTNCGLFSGTAYRADDERFWNWYAKTDGTRYDPQLIEEAIRIHGEKNKGRKYNLLKYNCIDYVNEVIAIAETLAQKNNKRLMWIK